jgi:hypothetical protein
MAVGVSRGSFFQVAKGRTRRRHGNAMVGRRVAGDGPVCDDVVEGRSPEWEVESEAERKRKDWLERTERTKPQAETPPKQSGRSDKGLEREWGEWKGFGAERCKGARPGRRVSHEGCSGKITPARAPGAERLVEVGLDWRVEPARDQVPAGPRCADGDSLPT